MTTEPERDENSVASQKTALACGALCAVIAAAVLAWNHFHPATRKQTTVPVHTHTVTFTCARTCVDLTKIPEVFPWHL
jgi:hypothetical protein